VVGGDAYLPCGIGPPAGLEDCALPLLLVSAFGLVAVWLGRESLTDDCAFFPVWLGVELSEAVDDGVAPLPALRLPLPLLGFDPFGIFASFEGEAMLGDAALPEPDVTVLPAEGFGVLSIAGLPAAGSGVCAETNTGDSNNAAVTAMVDRLKRN
jgi:hypothetical protein